MEECPEAEKVSCLVTDAATNMIACAKKLQINHTICIPHSLNLTVGMSCDQTQTLADIRNKTRQIAKDFRTSTTAREKLAQVELQMGGPVKKFTNEVSDGWNRTYGGAGVGVDVPGLLKSDVLSYLQLITKSEVTLCAFSI